MSEGTTEPETGGVTVELRGTVDLGPEMEGMDGLQLRTRRVTIEPERLGPVSPCRGDPDGNLIEFWFTCPELGRLARRVHEFLIRWGREVRWARPRVG